MIKKIRLIQLECDHEIKNPDGSIGFCKNTRTAEGVNLYAIDRDGWAFSNDRIKCYCPEHAPFHRYVGRPGKPRPFVQLKMEVIDERTKRTE